MMLLHQHFERAVGHSKHFSKLNRVDGILLGSEHAWLLYLDLLKFRDGFCITTSDTHRLQLTLVFFIFEICLREFLPVVIDLLID